eukprot:gene2126-2618_t
MCEVTKVFFDKGKYACLKKHKTKYMIHDPEDLCGIGDRVQFKECRPISKRKCHTLVKIVNKNPLAAFLQANPQYAVTGSEATKFHEKEQKTKYVHIKDLE